MALTKSKSVELGTLESEGSQDFPQSFLPVITVPLCESFSMDFNPFPTCTRSASNSPISHKKSYHLDQLGLHASQKSHSATTVTIQGEDHLVVNKKYSWKFSKKTKDINHPLHHPKSSEALIEFLNKGSDPCSPNENGFLPIHIYISKQKKRHADLLYTLLSHSEAGINSPTPDGKSPLHLAVMKEKNLYVIKILLIFGANINSLDNQYHTPLDLAIEKNDKKVITLLQSLGAVEGDLAKKSMFNTDHPRLKSFCDKMKQTKIGIVNGNTYDTCDVNSGLNECEVQQSCCQDGKSHLSDIGIVSTNTDKSKSGLELECVSTSNMSSLEHKNSVSNNSVNHEDYVRKVDVVDASFPDVRERLFSNQSLCLVTLKDMEDGRTLSTLYERLQQCINIKLELSGSYSANTDEAIAITMQQKELLRYKKTGLEKNPYSFNVNEGSRILFLDGGGMRGLIQIQILEALEMKTGRKVTELFDWIVGTSTGGIVALGLVYAKKSLAQLRQLYFKMKDKVFGSDRLGFAYNTDALEKLLKQEFGTSMKLSDVNFPRVVVTAVYKKTTIPELHFFNNCFQDEFSTQLVWKVARYTSAAPMFFREYEDYVDGGVLANNPCSYGLSAIQNFHRQTGQKLNISLVVSLGSGMFPAEELGKTDAHEFLYFGIHWLKAGYAIKSRAKSLMTLLTTALVESESVAKSFSSRLQEQGIPFYRFNPQLDEVIPSGETDLTKLLNMLIKTKLYILSQQDYGGASLLDELLQLLHLVADMNRKKSDRIANQ